MTRLPWRRSPPHAARGGRRRWRAAILALLMPGALAVIGAARAAEPAAGPALPPELAAVRDALMKYQDPFAAVRDGYLSTVGCVAYESGGMGVHFLNPAHIGPVPDPAKPPILVYEPEADGRLRLVAAEWFVPLATGVRERPTLFGRPFDGPMAGHEPLMPRALHHYDLHVWLFRANPAGLFNPVNPEVRCSGRPGYALLEEPPATVPHHR